MKLHLLTSYASWYREMEMGLARMGTGGGRVDDHDYSDNHGGQ
jgi:hypothetical protein